MSSNIAASCAEPVSASAWLGFCSCPHTILLHTRTRGLTGSFWGDVFIYAGLPPDTRSRGPVVRGTGILGGIVTPMTSSSHRAPALGRTCLRGGSCWIAYAAPGSRCSAARRASDCRVALDSGARAGKASSAGTGRGQRFSLPESLRSTASRKAGAERAAAGREETFDLDSAFWPPMAACWRQRMEPGEIRCGGGIGGRMAARRGRRPTRLEPGWVFAGRLDSSGNGDQLGS